MNAKKAKLLRKIAKLTSRTDTYIKNEYSKMDKSLQTAYLGYMRENLRRITDMRKKSSDSVVLDTKIGKEE